MRCCPHLYYFGTPAGAPHRHLIPVHIVLLRRLRDGVAPQVRCGARPKVLACAVWRNGMQRDRYKALCERTIADARAYRTRTAHKPAASRPL